jgi:cytochrome P450
MNSTLTVSSEYGNVVRINPSELHFADPEFFNDIYCNAQKKRDKWDWMVNGLFINKSLFGTVSHDLHRERRAALNNLFSKAQVRKQQKDVQRCVDIMLERMRVAGQNREVIDLKVAFAAFTAGTPCNHGNLF